MSYAARGASTPWEGTDPPVAEPLRIRPTPPQGGPVTGGPASRHRRYGPPLLLLLCGPAVLALVVFDAPVQYRAVPVLAYIVVVPGLAGVRLLGLADRTMEILLGIGLSLALGILVSQFMMQVNTWSPTVGLGALVVIASLFLAPALYPGRRSRAGAGDAP